MIPTTRVELHCHSSLSDGSLDPEALAERVCASGVAVASLTDHNQVEGLAAFEKRLERHGVGFIPGVEISARHRGREVHLLGYGFNPADEKLLASLAEIRQARRSANASLQKSAQQGARYADWEGGNDGGDFAAGLAIQRVHEAGGKVFLAHPLVLADGKASLDPWCRELKALGLDGLEVYYSTHTPQAITWLGELAETHGLLMSAGTDWHGGENFEPGVEMPHPAWRAFLEACCLSSPRPEREPAERPVVAAPLRRRWARFAVRFVLPSLLALGLFIAALFALLLPAFENTLLERKRELIRELARSARSIAEDREREAREGRLTPQQARAQAKERIAALRYGREGKDYFWIQDLTPRMVMHPWRGDLDGRDLSDFRDARGNRIFVAFADLVRARGEGYARYVWQWKDDARRIAAKESYVLGFEPWGWIIGTGMYTEDVREEIARLERGILLLSLAIALLVGGFLAWLVWQSLRLERERSQAEDRLRLSHERFRALVEAAREGTLHVHAGRCLYANPTLLEWLGYRAGELPLLHFRDLLPDLPANAAAFEALAALDRGEEAPPGCEAFMKPRRASPILCALGFSRMGPGDQKGFVVLVRLLQIGPGGGNDEERLLRLARMAEEAPLGLLRARASTGVLLAQNRKATDYLGTFGLSKTVAALADLFPGEASWKAFHARLTRSGHAQARVQASDAATAGRPYLLHAHFVPGTADDADFIDATLHDIRLRVEAEALRTRQIGELVCGEIQGADAPSGVSKALAQARRMARLTEEEGVRAISNLMGAAGDAATRRLVELAVREFGPAPAPFAFLALGSHGRFEQSFAADQDNAMIYGDVPAGLPDPKPYFLKVAARVCEGLAQGGLPLCKGGTNAMHAPWCRSLGEWLELTTAWITRSEPKDLMEVAIFFDFRVSAGDATLAADMTAGLTKSLASTPAFFPRFAQKGLEWKAPVRVFGKRLGGETATPDYKRSLMPLIHGVRLYAWREGLAERHTLDRLRSLQACACFTEEEAGGLALAWQTLSRLRLEAQLREAGAIADGKADAAQAEWNPEGDILLEHAFSRIEQIQRRLSRDFLGA